MSEVETEAEAGAGVKPPVAVEVREAREKLGLTLKAFAERFGVTLRAVQHWEAGTRKPGYSTLVLMRRMRKPKG